MWSSFRKNYPCTFDLITYSIGIFAGFCIWVLFHGSVYALLLAIFGGGMIVSILRGEKTPWWPKSVTQIFFIQNLIIDHRICLVVIVTFL